MCTRCKRLKPREEFHVDTYRTDGLFPRCKRCTSEVKEHIKCERCGDVKPYDSKNFFKDDTICRSCRLAADEKICTFCKKLKPLSAFYKTGEGRYMSKCGRCHNKHYAREQKHSRLLRTFGITVDEYEDLCDKQKNRCAICKKPETVKLYGKIRGLHTDHCHKTGKVRALLCSECNIGLGKFKDDPTLLRAAADYLERHCGES